MMWKKTVKISSLEEAQRAIAAVPSLVSEAGLPDAQSSLLEDQLVTVLHFVETQFRRGSAKTLRFKRELEGDRYLVTVEAGPPAMDGLWGLLSRLIPGNRKG
jgi:hypothetical protein